MVQGLRMLDGIELCKITVKTDTAPAVIFAPQIERLRERGLVEATGGILKVTHKGLLLMNDVAREFV